VAVVEVTSSFGEEGSKPRTRFRKRLPESIVSRERSESVLETLSFALWLPSRPPPAMLERSLLVELLRA
jgi:hypothetical protein